MRRKLHRACRQSKKLFRSPMLYNIQKFEKHRSEGTFFTAAHRVAKKEEYHYGASFNAGVSHPFPVTRGLESRDSRIYTL